MAKDWLIPGESEVGSWAVYVGGEGPTAAKVAGKIHITNLNFHFDAGVSLEQNAAALISNRIKAFSKSDEHLTIPFSEISGADIVKKGFLLKSLVVKLKTGEELPFHFGAMSPQKALDALNAALKK
ncbi:MAG: hypothetical protein JW843_02975 [Candidatus Aminicenantes bacterium]|nr:hypothetical protein [Candidatus Aminicenantes bacterium]